MVFFFVVPKYLEELKIPNPFTDRMEFYNQVLHELYAVIGDTLAPAQLKGYIITQREVRWKCKDETKRLSSYLSNISDGKSGQALNVKKYSQQTTTGFKAKDVHRAGNTVDELNKLFSKISSHLQYVQEMRKGLFGKELVINHWKANEMSFYDHIIKELTVMKGTLEGSINAVSHTYNNLRRRFHPQAVDAPEQKRVVKRKKDNKAKNEREKRKRLTANCRDLVEKITGSKNSIKDDTSDEIVTTGYKIKMTNICDNFQPDQLTPRFHLKPLSHLISLSVFHESAQTWAREMEDDLKKKKEETSETNKNSKKRKADHAKAAKQMNTIDSLFKKQKA